MKTFSLPKRAVVCGAILCAVLSVLLLTEKLNPIRLSEDDIEKLRDTYPICGINSPPLIELRTPSFSEIKELTDTFVYGAVIGDYSVYTKNSSVGNSELNKKQLSQGLNSQYTFYEYTVAVIQDTNNIYSPGEVITIASNIELIEYNPQLKDGTKVVVPVIPEKANKSRASYSVVGMYYVTADNYVLSAFDEQSAKMDSFSGIRVKSLLAKLSE